MQTQTVALPPNVVLVDNPLALRALSVMRNLSTTPPEMRIELANLTRALLPRVAKDLDWHRGRVQTPLGTAESTIQSKRITVVPVLRAGLPMLDPVMQYFTDVRAGFIWLKRHEDTAAASCLAVNLPSHLKHDQVLLLDGMVATGGSSIMALDILKQAGATDIRQMFVVAAPEGLAAIYAQHPDVTLYGPAVDQCLDSRWYIVPGLGDLGDRLYGTE